MDKTGNQYPPIPGNGGGGCSGYLYLHCTVAEIKFLFVTGEKMLITFAPAGDRTQAAWAEIRHSITPLYKPAHTGRLYKC